MFFSSFYVCRLDGVFDIHTSDFSKSVLFKFIMPVFIERLVLIKRIIHQLK